ncbi:hypothetical protein BHE18_00265 [Rossellomorea aquimaris]|uniref:Uncharacterized protein n=1 Tax=Rossellomorea aquimaris TaxID=189382 RepID=A0A1J6WYS6_9BACI|nr:hypothetical protein BHE18_00265 [Rossellomorea aquimaris]
MKTPAARVAYQKSGRALKRGGWRKTNRTGRCSLPSWSVWLMTCTYEPWSWTSDTPKKRSDEEAHGLSEEREVLHGNQKR